MLQDYYGTESLSHAVDKLVTRLFGPHFLSPTRHNTPMYLMSNVCGDFSGTKENVGTGIGCYITSTERKMGGGDIYKGSRGKKIHAARLSSLSPLSFCCLCVFKGGTVSIECRFDDISSIDGGRVDVTQ